MARKITPFLWFDDDAEEAANHYVSIFPRSRILTVTRYGDAGPGPKGSVMTVVFQLEGQDFIALNGGPHFQFNEAVSFVVGCDTQEEIDGYWTKLLAGGGSEQPCGWLEDKFGLSWQVVPNVMDAMMADPDPAKANRVMAAMLKMKKLDIAALEAAYAGE